MKEEKRIQSTFSRRRKRIRSAAAAFAALCLLLTGIPAADRSARAEGASAKLLWSDEFDGSTLDATKWKRCTETERGGGMTFWDDDCSGLNGADGTRFRSAAVCTGRG